MGRVCRLPPARTFLPPLGLWSRTREHLRLSAGQSPDPFWKPAHRCVPGVPLRTSKAAGVTAVQRVWRAAAAFALTATIRGVGSPACRGGRGRELCRLRDPWWSGTARRPDDRCRWRGGDAFMGPAPTLLLCGLGARWLAKSLGRCPRTICSQGGSISTKVRLVDRDPASGRRCERPLL